MFQSNRKNKMECKLPFVVGVCLVTLTLVHLVIPGQSQEEEVLRDQSEIDSAVCNTAKQLTLQYDFMNGEISCGQDVPLGVFHNRPPKVAFSDADKNANYLLAMVDPDAPSSANPTQKYWLHWLVTQMKGSDLQEGKTTGNPLMDYADPSPPAGSGQHRYQFYLYQLQKGHEQDVTLTSNHRGKFDLQAFVANLGKPVAVTQFKTKNA